MNIPPEIQKAIRAKAKEKRELPQERVETQPAKRTVHTDLDHLFGTWSRAEADEFDKALEEQRQIDLELWR